MFSLVTLKERRPKLGAFQGVPKTNNQRLDMKFIKLITVTAFTMALLTGPAFAVEKTDKTCCETAKEAGKECTHKCCVAAKKENKTCEKCNPKKDEKKVEKK